MATEQYRQMQFDYYNGSMGDGRNDVMAVDIVGNFEAHERYPYERYLLAEIPNPKDAIALDFGCGPGRMIRRMREHMKQVDGVDISTGMIETAKAWTEGLGARLWVIDGVSLDGVPSGEYDLVYCTISYHHIASYEMRLALAKEFFQVLKPGGQIALQMLHMTVPRSHWPEHVNWRESMDDARQTNGHHDVRLTPENLPDMEEDFKQIGFTNFHTTITAAPHPYANVEWIYIYATKPV